MGWQVTGLTTSSLLTLVTEDAVRGENCGEWKKLDYLLEIKEVEYCTDRYS